MVSASPKQKSRYIQNFYQNLFRSRGSKTEDTLAKVKEISPDDKKSLSKIFTPPEVWNYISTKLKSNKSPGASGFTAEFYKQFPELAKHLTDLFNEAFFGEGLSRVQKRGVLILFPKKGKRKSNVKNWRPITLLETEYKIYSGCLTERIKPIMEKILPETQFGFRSKRQMEDVTMSLQAMIGETKRKKQDLALICLDFEKAFDSIEHHFIIEELARRNFPEVFRSTIKLERGVRQGDPLSPMLFLLAIARLQTMMDTDLEGVVIGNKKVTNLFFADDGTIVMSGKSIPNDTLKLQKTLQEFGEKTGLKINVSKSQMLTNMADIPVSLKAFTKAEEATILGNSISMRDTSSKVIERVDNIISDSVGEISKHRLTTLG